MGCDDHYAPVSVVTHSHDLGGVIDPAERVGNVSPAGLRRAAVALAVVLLPILAATIAGLVLLWPSDAKQSTVLRFAAPGVTFPHGKVTAVNNRPCPPSGPSDGNPAPATPSRKVPICATATVTINDSSGAAQAVVVEASPEVLEAGIGSGVILTKTPKAAGSPVTYSIYDLERGRPLVILAVIFAVVTVAVARVRGLLALVGLGVAAVVVLGFMLPALVQGESPLWVGLTAAAAIMFVVLYLAHGFSLRTTTALLGTFGGLALTAMIGVVAVDVAHLNGISNDDNQALAQVAGQIDPRGLLTCGIILAGLGVLNDVTITQASAVWELREAAPGMTPRRLYHTAMRIGRDHIASTIYTIVFAYAGAALPILLLIDLYGQPLANVLTTSNIAEELVRTMASAIGLVLAVPLTTALAVAVATVGRRGRGNHRALAQGRDRA